MLYDLHFALRQVVEYRRFTSIAMLTLGVSLSVLFTLIPLLDPLPCAGVAAFLVTVPCLTCWLPALRAVRINPPPLFRSA